MAFDEGQHPRDSSGKFIETGGEKLKAWGKARPESALGGPALRDRADERVPRVGEFMRETKGAVKESPGGFTVRPGYLTPKTGTIVSLPTSAGLSYQIKPGEKASREKLREWVKKARSYLRAHDDTYIGGWKSSETGVVYFDVNERYADHDKAMGLGRKRNQEGVFRLDDMTFHPTGGTGA